MSAKKARTEINRRDFKCPKRIVKYSQTWSGLILYSERRSFWRWEPEDFPEIPFKILIQAKKVQLSRRNHHQKCKEW